MWFIISPSCIPVTVRLNLTSKWRGEGRVEHPSAQLSSLFAIPPKAKKGKWPSGALILAMGVEGMIVG